MKIMSEAELPKKMPGDYWLKKEFSFIDRIKQFFFRKKLSNELLEIVKKVAWELAQIFPYHTLAKSTIKSKANEEANEVHSYIELHYPLIYRKLIFDRRVIDLACLYARRDFKPMILNKIPLKELEKYTSSLMFIEPTELKNYSMVKFNKAVVFTEKNFYDSVAREEDTDIKWNGWPSKGMKIPFNQALLAFIGTELPMTLVTYTPGQHTYFYEADYEAPDDIDIQHQKERILTKAFHQARIELAAAQKEIHKTKGIAKSYARQLDYAEKEANRQRHKDFRSRIDEIERKKELERQKATQKPSKVKELLPLFITIVIIVGILIFVFLFLNAPQPSTTIPPESSSHSLLTFLQDLMKVI